MCTVRDLVKFSLRYVICFYQQTSPEEGSTSKKKTKTRRVRPIIKEPKDKDKMTMFDFIYYNPKARYELSYLVLWYLSSCAFLWKNDSDFLREKLC